MPLAPISELKEHAKLVGVTEFAIPDTDDQEMVKLHIYYAAPVFLDDKLTVSTSDLYTSFGATIASEVNDDLLYKLPSFGTEKTMLINKVELNLQSQ